NALVVVSGSIPPGARKGDPFDLEVALPPGSKATSLRGGRLLPCVLYNYDFAHNLSPAFIGSDRALKGHPVGRAEGPLLVGFGDGDEAARQKQGRIWGGGRCAVPRPLLLYMKGDKQYASIASAIEDRINERFHGALRDTPEGKTARAQDKSVVVL